MFIAVARPTLSVDRLLGNSFKTRKMPCDRLKVGRDDQMAQCLEAYWNCLQSTCYGCVACSEVAYRRNIYASLNGPLDLDDVELLSGKQSRLTGVVLRVACMFTGLPESVSFGACYLTVCDITCYLLMVDYVSVSLFCISVSSAHFAHFVANFISSHVV